MQMPGSFDANTVPPEQSGSTTLEAGMHNVVISNTQIKANSKNNGGYFEVEFRNEGGSINNRYNLWYASPDEGQMKAVEIANKNLSALCHATGIFRVDWQNEGLSLRNARLRIEVGPQIDKSTKQPNGYMEVKKVFDIHGNEPGKAPVGQAQQPQTMQAQPQANQPGWGNQSQPQGNANAQWGNAPQPNQPAPQPQQQPQQQAPQQGGWQQGPNANAPAGNKPPWG